MAGTLAVLPGDRGCDGGPVGRIRAQEGGGMIQKLRQWLPKRKEKSIFIGRNQFTGTEKERAMVEIHTLELILADKIVDGMSADQKPVTFGEVLRLAGLGNDSAIKAMSIIKKRGYISRDGA
jgi:hypothetical protein